MALIVLGLYSLRKHRLISIGIPIINLRRSSDRLRFIMGIPIPVRRRLLSEYSPRCNFLFIMSRNEFIPAHISLKFSLVKGTELHWWYVNIALDNGLMPSDNADPDQFCHMTSLGANQSSITPGGVWQCCPKFIDACVRHNNECATIKSSCLSSNKHHIKFHSSMQVIC